MKAAGMVTEAALSQTEATYYNICTTLLDLQEQLNQAENALSLLLADVPTVSPRTSGRPTAPGESIGRRTSADTLQPARRTQCRTVAGTGILHYQCCPFRLLPLDHTGGSAGWTNSAGAMIVNPGKFLATAVASLTQPLFNRGANIAQLRIAKAQQEEARLSFEQTFTQCRK